MESHIANAIAADLGKGNPIPSRYQSLMRPVTIWQVAMREALSTLRRGPVRTSLSILGIVVGSAGLAAILAISGGITSVTANQEASADPRVIRIEPQEAELIEGVFIKSERVFYPSPSSLATLDSTLVEAAGLSLLKAQRISIEGVALAIPAQVHLVSGPYFKIAHSDVEVGVLRVNEMVINQRLAALTGLQPADLIGRYLEVGPVRIPIAAIRRTRSANEPPIVLVPMEVPQAAELVDRPATVVVKLRETISEDIAIPALNRWVIEQSWPGAASIMPVRTAAERTQTQIRIVTLGLGAIASISIFVGAIGIMNIMLAAVVERTREIGVRMACGATRTDIGRQFLMESIVVSLVGSLLGIVLGWGVAAIAFVILRREVPDPVEFGPTLSASALILLLTIVIGTGVAAGWYPARRAARLAPAEAIRTE